MKILHTADWHIGAKLQGIDRMDEQQAVLDEIVDVAKKEDVDAVFVCGDVFHHTQSSTYAEKMILDTLIKLADGGRRAVVAIVGNHDDGEKLTACKHFAEKENIFLVNSLTYDFQSEFSNKFRINLVECGKGYLTFKKGDEKLVVNLMPYPYVWFEQEKTLKDESKTDKLARLYSCGAVAFEKGAINVSVGHFFTSTTKQKSDIYFDYPKDKIPKSDYVALGHVHDSVTVSESNNIYYCGSPYQVNTTENVNKYVNIVYLVPNKKCIVKKVKLTAHKNIAVVEIKNFDEVQEKLADKKDFLVSIKTTAEALNAKQIKEIKNAYPNIFAFNIIPTIRKSIDLTKRNMTEKQVFEAFCKSKKVEVDKQLLQTFEEVLKGDKDETD